jgi:hypothetical protein
LFFAVHFPPLAHLAFLFSRDTSSGCIRRPFQLRQSLAIPKHLPSALLRGEGQSVTASLPDDDLSLSLKLGFDLSAALTQHSFIRRVLVWALRLFAYIQGRQNHPIEIAPLHP